VWAARGPQPRRIASLAAASVACSDLDVIGSMETPPTRPIETEFDMRGVAGR
jgi:hypothetical protein